MKTIVVTRRENVKDEDKMRLDIDPTTQRIVTSNEDTFYSTMAFVRHSKRFLSSWE